MNYTGQQSDSTGLLNYNARLYDPTVGRFVSPDSIVPGASSGVGGAAGTVGQEQNSKLTVDFHGSGFGSSVSRENAQTLAKGFWFQLSGRDSQQAKDPSGPDNPQALSRYAYVLDNPLRYTDPTGHFIESRKDNRVRIILSRGDMHKMIASLDEFAEKAWTGGVITRIIAALASLGLPEVAPIVALATFISQTLLEAAAGVEAIRYVLQNLVDSGGTLGFAYYTNLPIGVVVPLWDPMLGGLGYPTLDGIPDGPHYLGDDGKVYPYPKNQDTYPNTPVAV